MTENNNSALHALSSGRLHALDNLRALLALLGIPFHACLLLLVMVGHQPMDHFNLYELVVRAPLQGAVLFLSTFFLHIFRMPAFFLLAGFFAHFIYERSSAKKFLANRLLRIALPLLFIIAWLYPVYLNAILFAAAHQATLTGHHFWPIVALQLKSDWSQGKVWTLLDNTRDAWFLDYLLWCYILTMLILFIRQLSCFDRINQMVHRGIAQCLFSPARYVLLPFVLSILMMTAHPPVWAVTYDIHIKPNLPLLTFYSVWYFFGWWLWQHHRDFSLFMKKPGRQLLYSAFGYIGYLVIYLNFAENPHLFFRWFALFLYTLTMILSVFGVLGLAWRHLSARSWLHYISASAYWVYLVQMPILLIIIPLIALLSVSFFVQWMINTLLCGLLCLASYHVLIRPTWLRHILGGGKSMRH